MQQPSAYPNGSLKEMAIEAFDEHQKPNWLDSQGELIQGVYLNMPNDVYHAIDAISSSVIKDAAKYSMKEVQRLHFSDMLRKPTPAMFKGTLIHEVVLEPKVFNATRFRLPSKKDFVGLAESVSDLKALCKANGLKTSGTKAELTELLLDAGLGDKILSFQIECALVNEAGIDAVNKAKSLVAKGTYRSLEGAFVDPDVEALCIKKPIDGELFDEVLGYKKLVESHPTAHGFFDNGIAEVSIIAFDGHLGCWTKARFDFISYDGIGVDLKSSSEISIQGLAKACRNYRYDIQQIFYQRQCQLVGIDIMGFVFVAVGTGNVKDVVAFSLDEDTVNKAMDDCKYYSELVRDALKKDEWQGIADNDLVSINLWGYEHGAQY